MKIKLKITFLLLLLPSFYNAADGNLTSLKVSADVVYFSTDEAKGTNSPNCMAVENSDKWTVSLNNATGKAIYALLVTASADNRNISIESANDCADVLGFERAEGVELGQISNLAISTSSTEFTPTFVSGTQIIPVRTSGDILVLTPPEGQRVRLNGLTPYSGKEDGISIRVGDDFVVSSLKLTTTTYYAGEFAISHAIPVSNGAVGAIPYLQGNINESIRIIKDSGSTRYPIHYSYSFSQ